MTARDYLPEAYQTRMQQMLAEEYPAYENALDAPAVLGIRANVNKIEAEELPRLLETDLKPVPWTSCGYYYSGELRPAKHPYYYAGLYYLQEASAMAPAEVLPVEPGDRVLDLCGAPGGKTTQLGMRMKGKGVLYANDISASRAQAMLKNVELAGLSQVFVTAETPERLAGFFPNYFDKILVDAPCSGEGMFRREPGMVKDWISRGPSYYLPLQRQILSAAVSMLRPGGLLLYSTCTFSREEDEENVLYLLEKFPELTLESIPPRPGFSADQLAGTVKLLPQRVEGEGQFLALLRKQGSTDAEGTTETGNNSKQKTEGRTASSGGVLPKALRDSEWPSFADLLPERITRKPLVIRGENVYLLPDQSEIVSGIHYLRTGLLLGSLQKGRFTPSQALAMNLKPEEVANSVDFALSDERVIRYLKGETISCESASVRGVDGWCLVSVSGYPLGWAKRKGSGLKNKYYPGWRWQ